ncbi:hypothetical protein HPB48_011322 [Haemaphysalis longicornis]|uniref:Uncharacterized protein n=1 Tax=Haemaphysalis longicornis TaxID=44386 RepID=A0A9J6G8I0_HAELO|nr:hypothetical protein HPB48_011322 [Haemaphysalis longicornis]
MLAYVKYDDNFKCILPVHLVKGFAPKGEEDFDPSKKIQAFWISEDRKVERFYPGFVHALAEIARDEARKLRPDPRGEVIAEFILPLPPGAANGDGPGQDLVGQYPEDDCIIPGYQGPAATSEDREVADLPETPARPVPPETVARTQWQRVVPPVPVVSTFLVADGQWQAPHKVQQPCGGDDPVAAVVPPLPSLASTATSTDDEKPQKASGPVCQMTSLIFLNPTGEERW